MIGRIIHTAFRIGRDSGSIEELLEYLDTQNVKYGNLGNLCLFCGTDKYDGKEGVIHKPQCIIFRLRRELKQNED